MTGITFLRTVFAAGFVMALAPQASASSASCEVTLGGVRIDGPCEFTARRGGSFDITMNDGRQFGTSRALSLDVIDTGIGRITGSGGESYGTADRLDSDRACWASHQATICVRAAGEAPRRADAPAQAAGGAQVITGRCHMDHCWWVRMTPAREVSRGSDAVPGRRVQSEIAVYDDDSNAGMRRPDATSRGWSETVDQGFFCSQTRPAVEIERGWVVLPLPQIFGVTEGITNMYLHACHPGRGDNPYAAVEGLGYDVAPNLHSAEFDSFEDLIAR